MNESEKLNALFTAMLDARWIAKERYRNGTISLLKEVSDKNQLDSLMHILKNLVFLTSSDVVDSATLGAKQIINSWSLTPDKTLIVGVAEGDKTCGSEAYVRALENHLPAEWKDSIKTQYTSAFRKKKGHEHLVLVDDFVGTGNKILDRINRLKMNPKTASYTIHFCGFAGMQEGYTVLNDELKGKCHITHLLPKCITGRTNDPERSRLINGMGDLEKNIFSKTGEFSLGFRQSETSFYLEGFNIPNNNFPILWWEKYADDTKRDTLFTRR